MSVRGALFAIACGGCASILGLDGTHFDQKDASIDAPNVCDGLPAACVAGATTNTICGQILQAGANAGAKLRAAAPTGLACASGGATDGPCELTAQAFAMTDFFAGGAIGAPVAIDDCGRYSVDNIDGTVTDAAISFAALGGGSGFVQTATLVNGLTATPALVVADAIAVTPDDEASWSSMLVSSSGGVDVSTGFLATFTAEAMPLPGDAATIDGDGAFTNPAGTVPWAAYFDNAFGTFDGSATVTDAAGTAFVVPGGGTYQLAGVRTGRRCKLPQMQQVTGVLLVVVDPGC